jgi:hypothetical protein
LASPTPWNNSSNSSLISSVSTAQPPASSASSSSLQPQYSPTLCDLKAASSNTNNTPIDGNNSFLPSNNFYSTTNPTATFASYDPSMRKMSLAELALSTCDGASCTNWTVGDNRENVAAALQSLMGRTNSGPMMTQPMFDLNSTATTTTTTLPVSNPSVDTLAFNLGFSNLDPYNPSSAS